MSVLVKLCLPFGILLWKFYFITATHGITGAEINICENVDDHIFLEDIEDCAKYIVCIDGEPKSQQCQPGLYFDARSQACTASKQNCLQCPPRRIINTPLLKTCDKYVSCYYGQRLLKKCDRKQQFNAKTGKCDFAKNVDCVENRCSIYATAENSLYLPSAASCANYYICQAGQVKFQTCNEGSYFNKECNCCDKSENVQCLIKDFKAPAENLKKKRLAIDISKLKYKPTLVGETDKVKCPSKGHFLYQYIEDPIKYYTCIEGKATLYACPAEFQFDDRLKRCMHKVQPMSVKLTLDNNDVNPDSEILSKPPNNGEEFPAVQSVVNCPMNGKTTMPHVQRNLYYLCIEGEIAVVACAAGLFYDDSIKSCTTHNVTESNSDIYSSHTNTNDSLLVCPELGSFIFPHREKNRYYICMDGKAIVFTCAQGHVFDITSSTCKNEKYQTENSDNQKPQVLDEPVDILCPPFGAMKYAHKQKHKFYLCVNGIGTVLACAEGSFFEPQAGVCRRTFDIMSTWSEQNATGISLIDQESSIECPIIGIFIYGHTDENLYHVCLDGNQIVLSCPEGLVFDNNKKICSAAKQRENFVDQTSIFQNKDENVQATTNIVDFDANDAGIANENE